ncbi:VIT1/CCC1 family predicted Fe2+/Mn2+ transporter [Tamaricihabitans halophyticus]|uniref:VIT1/CCC1 family predicted Fe2+/Mn2+ transporter n=1 Tax=Tamaricihabitans halophyticus TaxID=1262583 RepID=A0A4R2QFP3_9PSEU|nr:VIT1/CCC1 transporter family protein [Tamaricihabitans halophyticus]TCP47334.1 VIT1/CCC1 family predicted Fe2+/Mn2+ transporter [Tamaricihabitans halophyticus]
MTGTARSAPRGGRQGLADGGSSGRWLRPTVFGAMDGLVTNISLVAGVGGGGADRGVIVLAGLASLVARALSMALGEYASVSTQNHATVVEAEAERAQHVRDPGAEETELAVAYAKLGLSEHTARLVAREVHANPDVALQVHLAQELGIVLDRRPSAWLAGISSFSSFTIGGLIPLIPFLVGSPSLIVGLGVAGLGLFVAGVLTAPFTHRGWWQSGLRQLLLGAVAAGATYLIGTAIGVTIAG